MKQQSYEQSRAGWYSTLALTTQGVRAIQVDDLGTQVILCHWVAIIFYMNTGDAAALDAIPEKQLGNSEEVITLETRPEVIDRAMRPANIPQVLPLSFDAIGAFNMLNALGTLKAQLCKLFATQTSSLEKPQACYVQ